MKTRAANLTRALELANPALLKIRQQTDPIIRKLDAEDIIHTTDIDNPPTIQELRQLIQVIEHTTTLTVYSREQRVEVYFGTKDGCVYMPGPDRTVIYSPFEPGSLKFSYYGILDDACTVTDKGIIRVRNLGSEENPMPLRHPENCQEYPLNLEIYRRGMTLPEEKTFMTDQATAYWSNTAYRSKLEAKPLYGCIYTKVIGPPLKNSFALSGLPRKESTQARAELYFVTWQDFAKLMEYFGGNFFRVFNYQQPWIEFFTQTC